MTTSRAWTAVLSCAVCAGLVAGCGGDDNADSVGQTATPAPTVTATQTQSTVPAKPAKAPKPAAPGQSKPSGAKPGGGVPAKVVVPDVVGQSLADAQAALAEAGLAFRAEAKSGDRTQIRSDWEVCQSVPAAGKRAPGESPITLITAARGGC